MTYNETINLKQYNAIAPFPEEELNNLIVRAKNGDDDAYEKAFASNLNLVCMIVRLVSHFPSDTEDLFHEGCIALMKSLNGFDISYGVKFTTYASAQIRGTLKKFYRDKQLITGLRYQKELVCKAKSVKESLENKLGREVSLEEISEELRIPEEKLSMAFEAISFPMSLYTPIDGDDDGKNLCLMDTIDSQTDCYEQLEDRIVLAKAIAALSPEEKLFLHRRYVLRYSQAQIGELESCAQMKVSRQEKAIKEKIKRYFK